MISHLHQMLSELLKESILSHFDNGYVHTKIRLIKPLSEIYSSHININSFKDKLEILKPISTEMLHIGMIAETKLGIFVSAGTVLN